MQISQIKNSQLSNHIDSTPQSPLLEIKRTFHVPVNQLFAAFSSAEALKKWWWPRDLYSDHIELDFNQSGKYFINMKGSKNGGGGMSGTFDEIVDNKRIVMTDNFSDDKGNIISAKEANMPGEWPEVGFITFEFESLGDNRSGFKLFHEGIPAEVQKDCIQGWSESFDKLREYLES